MKVLAALIVSLAMVASASAAIVVTLDAAPAGPGTYDLTATLSGDASGGLSFFSIELAGITSALNMAPVDLFMGTIPIAGFTVGGADLAGPGELFAGQNSTSPATLIYGIGTGGSYVPMGTPKNIPWDEPAVLLGVVSAPDGLTAQDMVTAASINVFVVSGDAAAIGVDEVVLTPEPATMSLLVIGAAALLRRKR